MRIAIDARAFSWAGIGCYTRNLLQSLAKQDDANDYVVLLNVRDAKNFAALKLGPRWRMEPVEPSYYSWREQTVFLRQLNRVPADLFHFTHFNVPVWFRRPYVVTIHDTTRFIFPGQKRQDLLQQVAYEFVFKNAVERAAALITVSEATKNELVHLPFKIKARPRTIYEGVAAEFFQAAAAAQKQKARMFIGTNDPFVLFIGVWMSHKNLERLAGAFSLIASEFQGLKLVITGKPKTGYAALMQTVHRLDLERRVIFPGYVPDKLLPALYQSAACFVFPSLYEGFGLPALEAAASGTPVVASNVTSLPEIMGEAALYVNPENAASMAAGIKLVLANKETRDRLVSLGRARARRFSWESAARAHLQVYAAAFRSTAKGTRN